MQINERINSYWNRAAEDYNQCSSSMHASGPDKNTLRWQSLFCNALPDETHTILDVGTGPGIIAIMLAEMGYALTGIELSPEMLKFARHNAQKKNLSIRFEQSDADSLPFDDNSFDVIVSRHLLWTTLNPEKVLLEWMRVLKPHGKIVYVDGNWYKNDGTFKRKVWMGFSAFITAITELRDPRSEDLSEEMKQSLWSVKVTRPQYDREILEKIGFSDIIISESIDAKVTDWMGYLKEGYWGPRFMVSAKKPGHS
jgi:ubiquinone/menaquinone biosynthesis C-methylase UbiE